MKKRYSILLVISMVTIMMMSMGAAVFAEGEEEAEKFQYEGTEVTFIDVDGKSFGMWAPQSGTEIVRKGSKVYISIIPKNKTVYGWMHWGAITDSDLTKDIALTDEKLTFAVKEDMCGYAHPVAPVKPDGTTTGTQYYLAIPAKENITQVPTEQLNVTNNTNMFKAVSAMIETDGAQKKLTVALSGSGYENLFKGTYAAAIAGGISEEGKASWIKGYKNENSKWEFIIPLENDETRIPIVAISQSHLEKVEAGEEEIEQCMFYRLFEINYDAKTLTTGDYYEVNDFAITNNIQMFKPGTVASVKTTGTPSSNNYSNLMTLTMESSSYDKVKADSYTNYGGQMAVGDQVEIDLGDGNVFAEIPVKDGTQILKFHSASKDQWYNRKLTIDLENKTAVFDPLTDEEQAAEEVKDAKREAQPAVDEAEKLDTSVYLNENAAAIAAALTDLKNLIASDTATVEQINTAKTALENAIRKANDEKAAAEKAAKEKKAAIAKVQAAKVKGLKVKAGKKKMTVTWKKNKTFAGYQIWYKVGKKTRTVKITKVSTVKKVIKKLKSKKIYKVKIRGYKKIGRVYYGKWSAVRKAKIK